MTGQASLYFRIKDNGATVFRVERDGRGNRLDLDPLAQVNLRKGEIRPQGDRQPTEDEIAQINAWIDARRARVAAESGETPERAVEALNRAAQWAQAEADDDALEAATDRLLMAMHDLRTVLIRRKADRIGD